MMDQQIRVEYLSPERWNRLGEVLERIRPPRRILYALEGVGCKAVAYDNSGQAVDLAPWRREHGRVDGDGLLLAHPEFDELQLWPANALRSGMRASTSPARPIPPLAIICKRCGMCLAPLCAAGSAKTASGLARTVACPAGGLRAGKADIQGAYAFF